MAAEITVYHIGGETDEIGPIECVKKAGFPLKLVTFEATEGQCIDDSDKPEVEFYINKHPMSSGLYRPNTRYVNEVFADASITWGTNTALERIIKVSTTSIDAVREKRGDQPDVLSIDAQGAELRILRGATKTIRNVLCVVNEVEFAQIYEGQPLFDDQMAFLRPYGFRLMDLFSMQEWHHGRKFGKGFITVAEAVWLRHDYENLSADQIETLAMIAAGFGRLSYTLLLLERLGGKTQNKWLNDLWEFRNHEELRRL